MLTIQVTDDGQGYPPAVLAVLQAGETGENPPHILGLHVVEQILAAHGGTAARLQRKRVLPLRGKGGADAQHT